MADVSSDREGAPQGRRGKALITKKRAAVAASACSSSGSSSGSGGAASSPVEHARQLLNRVGLASKGDSYPRQLSGGQHQRVAIVRALAMDPKLMLFDEPTSALDPEIVGDVLDVIRSLAKDGMTMLVATYEMSFAQDVADRVVFMDAGVVVDQGPPDLVLRDPQHERTKRFLARLL